MKILLFNLLPMIDSKGGAEKVLALVQILGLGCYMSVGRPSPQLWVDLLQYVGRASTNFVVDLVHVIGFQWLERIAPAIFVFKE